MTIKIKVKMINGLNNLKRNKMKQETLEEVECNNCGYLMSLKEDESIYICTNSECTSCYDEEFTEHCGDCHRLLEDCTCIEDTIDMKETLEEAFEKNAQYLDSFENKNTYEYGFRDGAKWQQERSYSEEDMIAFGEFIFKHSLLAHSKGVKNLFEQFKKK